MIDGFHSNTLEGVLTEFSFGPDQIRRIVEDDSMEIIYAMYNVYGYEGDAWVIYVDKRDGQLYEVHSCHCSCDALEWSPESTSLASIAMRPDDNSVYPGIEAAIRCLLAAIVIGICK